MMNMKGEMPSQTRSKLEDVRNDSKDIKEDLKSLKTNIVGLAHQAVETGAEGVSEARKMAGEQIKRLRSSGAETLEKAESRIRERPAQSVAIAFLAGVLVNALLRK